MIIVSNKSGQLANRLFLFAHLIAFAAEHSLTVFNPSMDEYSEYFEVTSHDLFCRFPKKLSIISATPQRQHWVYEMVALWTSRLSKHQKLLPTGVRIIDTDLSQFCDISKPAFRSILLNNYLVTLRGWRFRDSTAFQKHADIIRGFFEPIPIVKQNVFQLIATCRQEADIIVGIHIRRGDYKDFMSGKYFYSISDYKRIMCNVENMFSGQNVLFLICSNEALQKGDFEGFQYRFGNSHIAEDLYSFAQCDYIVGPPSTYTMWASFYGSVPLCQVTDLNCMLSLSAFSVADGNCDLAEDLESCRSWDETFNHSNGLPEVVV